MKSDTLSRFRYLLFLLNFSGPAILAASGFPAPLNSERIAERYGNYGIEILQSGNGRRLSSLYSTGDGQRTMRTLALVEFIGADNALVTKEHERILAGESIGVVFKEQGWSIEKISSRYCVSNLDLEEIAELSEMDVDLPATFATHNYIFRVQKDGITIDYATITEIHHPDYLQAENFGNTNLASC